MYKAASTNRHWFVNPRLRQVIMIHLCVKATPSTWEASKIRASHCFYEMRWEHDATHADKGWSKRVGVPWLLPVGTALMAAAMCWSRSSAHTARFAFRPWVLSLSARSGLWWVFHQKITVGRVPPREWRWPSCQFMALSSEVPGNPSSRLHSTGGFLKTYQSQFPLQFHYIGLEITGVFTKTNKE